MRVWIVLEEDRGYGVCVVGVFDSYEKARHLADKSSHYHIDDHQGSVIE